MLPHTCGHTHVVRPPSDCLLPETAGSLPLQTQAAHLPDFSICRMGANVWSKECPTRHAPAPFRENTLKSFHRAAAAGAAFVEFDVQVTRDGVPVIWHDNFVVTGDVTAPRSRLVSELTLAEFKSLTPIPKGSGTSASSEAASAGAATADPLPNGMRLLRQARNDVPAEPHEPTLRAWEAEEEDALPTLAEAFAALPASLGFDIEVKMATPDHVACTPAEEVARVLDAVLAVMAAHGADAAAVGRGRSLMFSSFDPEICTALKSRWVAGVGGHACSVSVVDGTLEFIFICPILPTLTPPLTLHHPPHCVPLPSPLPSSSSSV
jgi:glycerophosphoryl diester phosphodiesterase